MSNAVIDWLAGPVVRARVEGPFQINEAVLVGPNRLLGEVIRIQEDEIVLQVYEDTTGLRPGNKVEGQGQPLSARLGPGLLGHIFDGLLRPLSRELGEYVHPGLRERETRRFPFEPLLDEGAQVRGGEAFGRIHPENGREQQVLVPPRLHGRVRRIAGEGDYDDEQTLLEIEQDEGEPHQVAMSHRWPVRQPRPIAGRLGRGGPMLTGQRILDALFPVSRGGKAALPGGFGTGKTILQESLAKWCDADIIVYVGCGERGNEMSGVLHEFPELEDPRTGRPLMERTIIIANTSNMPVAAREASIYTGVAVGEYFRDQGLNVALMADSTSRWAEALREVSGRLGELPGEGGYPAYLSSRLAEFYERAAHVQTLSGERGSLTIIGAVSPPSGDFSEPVTTHTKRYVRCFWALDAARAQARFYPAVNPLTSYSEDVDAISPWWQERGYPQWDEHRRLFLGLLEEQSRLERMARIVGKDALPPRQQLTLLSGDLINEGFLRQSAFSENDRYATPERQAAMMRVLARFIELARQAVEQGAEFQRISESQLVRRLRRMGEDIPADDLEGYDKLYSQVESELGKLTESATDEA